VWKDTFFIGCDKNDIKAALSLPTTAILVGDTKDSVNNDSVQKFENLLEFAKAV
jgi:hypothetical protein